MKLTDQDKQTMTGIFDDLSAMLHLHSNDNSVQLVFDSHTMRINKAATRALVYLARKGLENDIPTAD